MRRYLSYFSSNQQTIRKQKSRQQATGVMNSSALMCFKRIVSVLPTWVPSTIQIEMSRCDCSRPFNWVQFYLSSAICPASRRSAGLRKVSANGKYTGVVPNYFSSRKELYGCPRCSPGSEQLRERGALLSSWVCFLVAKQSRFK